MDDAVRGCDDLLGFALGLPEAWEDHPWGDTVVRERRRTFAFLGDQLGANA
ncbi:MAG TPA: hypothetical protein VGL20_06625 [Candidatus Dormibacteraeota bacterium]